MLCSTVLDPVAIPTRNTHTCSVILLVSAPEETCLPASYLEMTTEATLKHVTGSIYLLTHTHTHTHTYTHTHTHTHIHTHTHTHHLQIEQVVTLKSEVTNLQLQNQQLNGEIEQLHHQLKQQEDTHSMHLRAYQDGQERQKELVEKLQNEVCLSPSLPMMKTRT